MKRFFCTAAAAALGLVLSLMLHGAPPGSEGITIMMGQSVTVTLRALGPMLGVTGVTPGESEAAGTLVFSLTSHGSMKVLTIHNRTGMSLTYRCLLKKGDHLTETNVLPLLNLSGLNGKFVPAMNETWQEPFDGVVVRDFAEMPEEEQKKPSQEGASGSAESMKVFAEAPAAGSSEGAKQPPAPVAEMLDISVMGRFQASLERATLLYEMDAAGWAGTDALQPVVQSQAGTIPADANSVSYVTWKNGDSWNVLFYYSTATGEHHPIAMQKLGPPLTHQSRGETQLFDLAKKDPMPEPAARLALVSLKGHELYEKVFGKPLRAPFNAYETAEDDGSNWFYVIPGDEGFAAASAGPSFAVHFDAKCEKVLDQRRTITEHIVYKLMLGSGENKWPDKPVLKLAVPYPEAEDMLFLMLHPMLSPIVAVSSSGTYVLRAGELPEFHGSRTAEAVMTSLTARPFLPGGDAPSFTKAERPASKTRVGKEIGEDIRKRGAALFFNDYMITQAIKEIAGNAPCPDMPGTLDAFVDVQGDNGLFVYFIPAGSETPCLAVKPKGPLGPGNEWSFEVMKSVPPPSAIFKGCLALIRTAKARIDQFLGPGRHFYCPFLAPTEDLGQVYVWSQLERNVEPGWSEDRYLVGSCLIMTFAGKGGIFTDVGDTVADSKTPGWSLNGASADMPFGIRSVSDPETGYFGEFEVLRCRLNSWLCPRLMRNEDGWVVVQGDGSYEVLTKHQGKKLKSVPRELYPKTVLENRNLEEYRRESPTVLNKEPASKQ